MSTYGTAECVHAKPKCIPLLTSGEVSPMVMRQWEMVCKDFFSANKKLEEADRVAAVLPGLKNMQARDWVATHHSELTAVPFPNFMKQLCKEFLSNGWDDELHARICNACLRPSDSFAKWVNDIRHLNIIKGFTLPHTSWWTPCTLLGVYKESTGTLVGLHREFMDTVYREDSDCHSL
jgi:hypothetical protein